MTAITPLNRCSVMCAAELAANRPQIANGGLDAVVVSALDTMRSQPQSNIRSDCTR
jgi:hypothetical protein